MSKPIEQAEITIQIDFHSEDIFRDGQPFEWYSSVVNRNDEHFDILWWGLCYETYEQAEGAARDYLRGLVRE